MLLSREPKEDTPEFQKKGRGREVVTEERVVEEGLDVVDGEGGGEEEVGVGEGGVVEGEVGRGVVGDQNSFGSEEGKETGTAGEEEEVGEGEPGIGEGPVKDGGGRRCAG
ncbi:hypothetical protein V8G54_029271 [Vigna mungo]|uniref:Uncharacterized protein n=1 Tax=Vigna mungo TaxID=3915 RepID=A0AAQ3RMG6_VIGMU